MRRIVLEPLFEQEVSQQAEYYVNREDRALADRFLQAIDSTIELLANKPEKGKRLKLRHGLLQNVHSNPIEKPFDRLLLFYQYTDTSISFMRMLHSARNIPRRLREGEVDQF